MALTDDQRAQLRIEARGNMLEIEAGLNAARQGLQKLLFHAVQNDEYNQGQLNGKLTPFQATLNVAQSKALDLAKFIVDAEVTTDAAKGN